MQSYCCCCHNASLTATAVVVGMKLYVRQFEASPAAGLRDNGLKLRLVHLYHRAAVHELHLSHLRHLIARNEIPTCVLRQALGCI